jgi:gas vesicle protein
MHELLFFIIGCLLGGIVGVVTMCLLQINRLNDNYTSRKEDKDL